MAITYMSLSTSNFFLNSLDNFKRYQKVTECWRKIDGEYVLRPVSYTEDWSLDDCRDISAMIIEKISKGAIAFGANHRGEIIGFALIDTNPFGSKNQYFDLAELYVSAPFRGRGIGKKLFELSAKAVKDLGGTKLYISAHSAKDSIAAYKSYGCVFAKEINSRLAEKEPCDLQLEYKLK